MQEATRSNLQEVESVKAILSTALLIALIFVSATAFAEPFDTPHRINISLGLHRFFPEGDGQEGAKPNSDGVVTDSEFAYIFDEGYDISNFDGLTIEAGYEYLFFHWFGLATDLGIYGGNHGYDFKVEGIEANTDITINVLHVDLAPRFHWQTRWTDLYGGPVIGIYAGAMQFDIDVNFMDFNFSDSDRESDTALGWGLNLGFELRISEHWGIAIEDRLTSAVLFADSDNSGSLNAGGNVLMIMGVFHL
jgi:hypothetical protein